MGGSVGLPNTHTTSTRAQDPITLSSYSAVMTNLSDNRTEIMQKSMFQMVKHYNTNFFIKLKTYRNKSSYMSQIQISCLNLVKSYQNIEQKICTFNALPHADSKLWGYSFNKAMITGLKTMINNLKSNPKKKKINQIFVPLKVDQDQLQQANAESQLKKSNEFSKAIDFLLVHYQNKNFIVNAFDVAITSDIQVIDDKLKKFLDNYEKIEKESKFEMDKNQYTMKVNYYVLSNFPRLQEIKKMLLKYEGKIGNTELDLTRQYNIKANHAKEQILGEIGHYSLNSEFKIQSRRINRKVNTLQIIVSFLEKEAKEKIGKK